MTSELSMARSKQPNQDTSLENLSVNSRRRSEVQEDGTGNPVGESGQRNTTDSAKVPDQQISVEHAPGIEDTEGHPT